MKTRRWGLMGLAVMLALALMAGCQAWIKPEEPEVRSYNTPCYQEQGGGRWVCGDGGELAILAGGTLAVAGDADFTGATVTGFSPSELGSDVTITGDLVISGTTLAVGTITGDVVGDLTGDVIGNVTGDVTGTLRGNVTGNLTGDVMSAEYVTTTSLYVSGGSNFDGGMNVNANGDFDSLSTLAIDSSSYYNSTGAFTVNDDAEITGTLTVDDEIVFGADQLYVLGVGLPGFQFGGGRLEITGTAVFTHATGLPWSGVCTLDTVAPDYAFCGIEMSTNSITITIYSITETAQSVTPVWVNWMLLGIPSPPSP